MIAKRLTHILTSKDSEGWGELCFSPALLNSGYLRKQGVPGVSDEDVLVNYFSEQEYFRLHPSRYFVSDWYAARYQLRGGLHPWLHYCVHGERHGNNPNYLFHVDWYRKTYGLSEESSPLLDYVSQHETRHPCPYFDSDFYKSQNPDVYRSRSNPFLHYLNYGHREQRSPHPFFDVEYFQHFFPAAKTHPLAFFLDQLGSKKELVFPHSLGGDALLKMPYADLQNLFAQPFWETEPVKLPLPANMFLEAFSDHRRYDTQRHNRFFFQFDHSKEAEVVTQVRVDCDVDDEALSLVSVIIPTRNRDGHLAAAVRSVLKQTHQNLEVIVVNDGGGTSTETLLKDFGDERIKYVYQDWKGVSAARNTGLRTALGSYIAFLDSDNQMVEYFIETMLKYCINKGVKFAYSGLRMFNDGTDIRYRGEEYDAEKLKGGNYIDMNIIFHEREFFEDVQFDEQLKRCVDWEYILRLCSKYEPAYVPIIGCNYLHDSGGRERITTNESINESFKVFERFRATGGQRPTSSKSTLICALTDKLSLDELRQFTSFVYETVEYDVDVLVLANSKVDPETCAGLSRVLRAADYAAVHRVQNPASAFILFNLGLAKTRESESNAALLSKVGELDIRHIRTRLRTMSCSLLIDAHRSQGTFPVVYNDVLSSKPGIAYVCKEDLVSATPRQFVPVSGTIFLNKNFRNHVSFDPHWGSHLALARLCLDLAREDGSVNYEPGSVDFDVDGILASKSLWEELDSLAALNSAASTEGVGRYRVGGSTCHKAKGSVRQAFFISTDRSRTADVGIMCPAPSEKSVQWGDLHYCMALKRAFDSLGKLKTKVITRGDWDRLDTSCDQYLHVCGIIPPQMNRFRQNHLWCISHPNKFSGQLFDEFSTISVASKKLAADWSNVANRLVHPVLQCSEFNRREVHKLRRLEDKLIFIGNTKSTYRSAIHNAIREKLPLLIIGEGWDSYVSQACILGTHLENSLIPHFYGSALAVINEHWETMRLSGILSNRLFDVVCSGGRVITDECVGLEDEFDGFGYSFNSQNTLNAAYQEILSHSPMDDAYDSFIEKNSFENRATRLTQIIYGE